MPIPSWPPLLVLRALRKEMPVSEPHNYSAENENVAAGLDDARATIAEIWRRTDGDRGPAMRALQAVIAAERTMKAADAFLLAKTPRDRRKAFEELHKSSCLRIGHDVRPYP
jgi:hypothetical protein